MLDIHTFLTYARRVGLSATLHLWRVGLHTNTTYIYNFSHPGPVVLTLAFPTLSIHQVIEEHQSRSTRPASTTKSPYKYKQINTLTGYETKSGKSPKINPGRYPWDCKYGLHLVVLGGECRPYFPCVERLGKSQRRLDPRIGNLTQHYN